MSVALMCPVCSDEYDIELVRVEDDGARVVRHRCGWEWTHGAPRVARPKAGHAFDTLKSRFPKPEDVDTRWAERAERLKAEFLRRTPQPDTRVAAYWARYQHIFSREGLWTCSPQDLKDFANTETGARPGNMAVFNNAWNQMGSEAAAESTRRTIEYLLYGPEEIPLEDRLQELLAGAKPFSMTGFKESLLTKVLCIVQPERFLPILKYTTDAGGKREIAELVYGLPFPAPESVGWTLGRLVLWSNDVLHELVGDGFVNPQHASAFLWWAKDQPGGPTDR